MSDDPVGVVAEDVFSVWRQCGGAMEGGGEVVCEERPDAGGAEDCGAEGKSARVVAFEEVEGDGVGN